MLDHALWSYKSFPSLSLSFLFPPFISTNIEVVKTASGCQFKSFPFFSILLWVNWALTFLPTNLYPGLCLVGQWSKLMCPFSYVFWFSSSIIFDLDGKSEEKRIAKHVYLCMWPDTLPYLTHLWQAMAWGVLTQTQVEKVENTVSISSGILKWSRNTDFEEMFSKLG